MQGNQYQQNQYQIMAYRQQQQMPVMMPMPQVHMPPPMQPDAPEAGMFQIIWRRKWIVLLVMLIAVGAGLVYLHEAPKRYTASSELTIEPRTTSLGEVGKQIDDMYRNKEVQVIKSPPILQDALSYGEGLAGLESLRNNPLSQLRKYTTVDMSPRTGVITVSFESSNPEESKKIVAAIVDVYITRVALSGVGQANKVLKALREEYAVLETAATETQNKLDAFRDANPSASVDISTAARAAVEEKMVALNKAELEEARARIEYEMYVSAVTKKKWEMQAALTAALRESLTDSQNELYSQNKGSRDLARLEDDADRAFDKLKRKDDQIVAAEARLLNEQQVATVEVITPAADGDIMVSPQRSRVLAVALAAGLVLGIGAGLLRDYFDQRLRSAEEVMATLGVPVLGTIPHMSRRLTAVQRGQTVFLDPMSIVAEAFRTVRTAVYFSVRSERGKTLLITSAEPGDGKSTNASNLAIAMSQAGQRTLLLDCDFRKPTQHKIFEVSDAIGVSTVLAGRESLDRAVQRTAVEGLDLLPGGPIPLNPSEILNSQAFADMLDELSVKYDHIVIDSPPVNAVTDARILAALCDVTLLVMRAEKTTRRHAEYARDGLMSVGARLLGTVVNDVSRGKSRSGFYSGYGYYGQAANAVNVTGGPATTRVTPRRMLPRDTDLDERIA